MPRQGRDGKAISLFIDMFIIRCVADARAQASVFDMRAQTHTHKQMLLQNICCNLIVGAAARPARDANPKAIAYIHSATQTRDARFTRVVRI